ncbi:MAG: SDR family NAD(P)-dependent oxidoreductase [Sumerlaeia bacterium]
MKPQRDISQADWNNCLRVLRSLARGQAPIPDEQVLKGLVTRLYKQGRKRSRQRIFGALQRPPAAPPAGPGRDSPPACYQCGRQSAERHPDYAACCFLCGEDNLMWRERTADLRGRVALVTGGRVKSGFAVARRLLACGAEVHVTTRFPADAWRRFGAEAGFETWRDRLFVHGLDFRDVPALEAFAGQCLSVLPHLDLLVNNAARTNPMPDGEMRALLAAERPAGFLPGGLEVEAARETGLQDSSANATLAWNSKIGDVRIREMVAVQLINVTAPFVLCRALRPLLARAPLAGRTIVYVTSQEGRFARRDACGHHPHTNMAKASLNILTRTCAADYAADGIAMVSIDPGWFSGMNEGQAGDFQPPLTPEDAAARILQPFWEALDGESRAGELLKNFRSAEW